MYLLVGSAKALLIDSGDVADPKLVPLASTVMRLLPGEGASKLPLLVVHTHRHFDHRAGDTQFAQLPNVEIVGFDFESVRRFYNFTDWPNGVAQLNLGDRTVDVIPSPGHNETEISFYDRKTGLFFSGDFLMPARLLVDDAGAYLASAERAAAFVRNRPVSFILGGHIEVNSAGDTFDWESQYHPNEHVLQMTNDDLLALPRGPPQLQWPLHGQGQVHHGKFHTHTHRFGRSRRRGTPCSRVDTGSFYPPPQAGSQTTRGNPR